MLDKVDWVWGYERLGDWFPMKLLLAFVFTVVAVVTVIWAFHTYDKILQGAYHIGIPVRDILKYLTH